VAARPGHRAEPGSTLEFLVSRRPDRISQDIASAFVQGRRFGGAWLDASSVTKKDRIGALHTMNGMQITSYLMSGNEGNHLETLTLNCDGIRMKSIGGAGPSWTVIGGG
jgi:hypothetical protein